MAESSKRKLQESFLEEILDDISDVMGFYLLGYLNKHISPAPISYVSPSELPHGRGWRALGKYNPKEHRIYIVNNLSPRRERFVRHHEIAHSKGIYDEHEADLYAARMTGDYELIRRAA